MLACMSLPFLFFSVPQGIAWEFMALKRIFGNLWHKAGSTWQMETP